MKPEPRPQPAQTEALMPRVFTMAFGLFLGLCLLKFGNPPITEKWVVSPEGFWEFLIGCPWPIIWAYTLLALVGFAGVAVARWTWAHSGTAPGPERGLSSPQQATKGNRAHLQATIMADIAADWKVRAPGAVPRYARWTSAAPKWLVALPLAWLIWQFVAATRSWNGAMTAATVKHFAACVLCFYLGLFSLSRIRRLGPFWLGLTIGFLMILAIGWEQQLGGLKESRRYFFAYVYPTLKDISPEYLKKISSDRIFATLFYPNALAGALLLLLPVTLAAIWQLRRLLTPGARWFLIGLVGSASLACLYWSGSKGGWLLMLLLGLIALLRLRFSQRLKVILVTAILFCGLASFFWRYAAFFKKGATSVSARFDYWQAALHTAKSHPLLGTGPGTFALAYEKIKRPESEMSRLVHNDYLEQATDSGWIGFLLYTALIVGALIWTYPKRESAPPDESGDWPVFAVWLGVLGWSLQSLFEFGLYLPALAWPAFTFLGLLLGRFGTQYTTCRGDIAPYASSPRPGLKRTERHASLIGPSPLPPRSNLVG